MATGKNILKRRSRVSISECIKPADDPSQSGPLVPRPVRFRETLSSACESLRTAVPPVDRGAARSQALLQLAHVTSVLLCAPEGERPRGSRNRNSPYVRDLNSVQAVHFDRVPGGHLDAQKFSAPSDMFSKFLLIPGRSGAELSGLWSSPSRREQLDSPVEIVFRCDFHVEPKPIQELRP